MTGLNGGEARSAGTAQTAPDQCLAPREFHPAVASQARGRQTDRVRYQLVG